MVFNYTKGKIKIYTKRVDMVNKAIKEGEHIVILKDKTRVFGLFKL